MCINICVRPTHFHILAKKFKRRKIKKFSHFFWSVRVSAVSSSRSDEAIFFWCRHHRMVFVVIPLRLVVFVHPRESDATPPPTVIPKIIHSFVPMLFDLRQAPYCSIIVTGARRQNKETLAIYFSQDSVDSVVCKPRPNTVHIPTWRLRRGVCSKIYIVSI